MTIVRITVLIFLCLSGCTEERFAVANMVPDGDATDASNDGETDDSTGDEGSGEDAGDDATDMDASEGDEEDDTPQESDE